MSLAVIVIAMTVATVASLIHSAHERRNGVVTDGGEKERVESAVDASSSEQTPPAPGARGGEGDAR
jgi:hypothetical protein